MVGHDDARHLRLGDHACRGGVERRQMELKGVEAFTTRTRSYGDRCEIERASLLPVAVAHRSRHREPPRPHPQRPDRLPFLERGRADLPARGLDAVSLARGRVESVFGRQPRRRRRAAR
eukprot:7005-Pelagococcus_subviridis.AAC.2